MKSDWSSAYWRDQHPLGIERASHITIVVRDLPAAKRLYVDVLNGKLMQETETAGRKRSAFVAVGEDSVVELAQPLATDSAEARDMEQNGEGIHALTFKTRDLNRASEFLRSRGLRPQTDGAGSLSLSADQAFGMVIGFTDQPLPQDPR
jgi:catechol 2,3-dioxygenase-like lactoylglutathione lyase family enzyme